ncbi:hypothetical protein [Bacteroides heparinolyticus]|uniref:hypothetical protein n=1 Tax=Prevotella heparinolytica TaxID=28113 RepID=UPI0035A0358B
MLITKAIFGVSGAITLYGEDNHGSAYVSRGDLLIFYVANNSDTNIRAEASASTMNEKVNKVFYLHRFGISETVEVNGGNDYPAYYDLSLSVNHGWLIGNHYLSSYLIYVTSSYEDEDEDENEF